MSCYTVLQNAPNIIAINISNDKGGGGGGGESLNFGGNRGEFNSMYSSVQNI